MQTSYFYCSGGFGIFLNGCISYLVAKATNDEGYLRKYLFKKFDRDYYPRIIAQGRLKIDLDKSGLPIKEQIINMLEFEDFEFEFLPEDEQLRELFNLKWLYSL